MEVMNLDTFITQTIADGNDFPWTFSRTSCIKTLSNFSLCMKWDFSSFSIPINGWYEVGSVYLLFKIVLLHSKSLWTCCRCILILHFPSNSFYGKDRVSFFVEQHLRESLVWSNWCLANNKNKDSNKRDKGSGWGNRSSVSSCYLPCCSLRRVMPEENQGKNQSMCWRSSSCFALKKSNNSSIQKPRVLLYPASYLWQD